MKIFVTTTFSRTAKKLHPNQKKALDRAIAEIAKRPGIGDAKVGDLEGIYVYKFKIGTLLYLLGYSYMSEGSIKLLVLGPHENFYRDLKRS